MHELGIATEIIEIVEKEIKKQGIPGIEAVCVKVGALAGIDPESLKFGFEAASTGTTLDGAKLEIEWITVKGKCLTCGKDFEIDDYIFLCPNCDSVDVEILQGEELDIVQLITKEE